MRRPRAFLVSFLTTLLLAGGYVTADVVGWLVQRRDLADGNDLFSLLVLRNVRPFLSGAFGDQVAGTMFANNVTDETRTGFAVGAGVALFVFLVLVWLIGRKGGLIGLLAAWFATMAATVAGCIPSGLMWRDTFNLVELDRNQVIVTAIDHGLMWGFVFGWIPALVVSLLTAALRRPASEPDEDDDEDVFQAEPSGLRSE
ncbi:MAG TPA: hypothetical protein VGJ41_09855 [Nocardioides sp.]|jgi:hypothetical protein